ncbi:MAG: hypothetical protein ACREVK_03955 [Gammaproteobacteria bacterium]
MRHVRCYLRTADLIDAHGGAQFCAPFTSSIAANLAQAGTQENESCSIPVCVGMATSDPALLIGDRLHWD